MSYLKVYTAQIGMGYTLDVRQGFPLEHERVEDELEARVRALDRELETFTYSVSHDLRAPLRAVKSFSALLVEEAGPELDENCREYVRHIREASDQMERMVDGLLQLSRIGRGELSQQPVELRCLVDGALTAFKADLDSRGIEVEIGDLPAVACDPTLIRQVFANLLSNAVKFTRPRQRAVIQVGHGIRDGQAAIFVRDNGVGFDMRYAGRLFQVFQRLHSQEEFEGTGIGLATVQRIIRKHHGRVWAEAEPDKGATFHFTLGERSIPG